MEKSHFLCLAYQMQSGGATNHDCLAGEEAEVRHLREELEASQQVQAELHEGLITAISDQFADDLGGQSQGGSGRSRGEAYCGGCCSKRG